MTRRRGRLWREYRVAMNRTRCYGCHHHSEGVMIGSSTLRQGTISFQLRGLARRCAAHACTVVKIEVGYDVALPDDPVGQETKEETILSSSGVNHAQARMLTVLPNNNAIDHGPVLR